MGEGGEWVGEGGIVRAHGISLLDFGGLGCCTLFLVIIDATCVIKVKARGISLKDPWRVICPL